MLSKIDVLSIKIDPITVNDLHKKIEEIIEKGRKGLILHVNIHCLNLSYKEVWLRDFLNSAEIVVCDGDGVRWGAKMLGQYIPQRITYADWIWHLCEFCGKRGYSLFFLGAREGVAERAAERLMIKYSDLKVVGIHHGYFQKNGKENTEVIELINTKKPNILILGLGMPIQERWLCENWERINANIFLTGGAVFDFVSGIVPRCPRWMADNSLEWFFRFIIEPKRMFRRYIIGNPLFFIRILKGKYLS